MSGLTLDADFARAAERVKNLRDTPSEDEMLEIYALYKQAVVGDCDTQKPGTFDFKGKFKWEAWNSKKGMDKDAAKRKYIEKADTLVDKYGLK